MSGATRRGARRDAIVAVSAAARLSPNSVQIACASDGNAQQQPAQGRAGDEWVDRAWGQDVERIQRERSSRIQFERTRRELTRGAMAKLHAERDASTRETRTSRMEAERLDWLRMLSDLRPTSLASDAAATGQRRGSAPGPDRDARLWYARRALPRPATASFARTKHAMGAALALVEREPNIDAFQSQGWVTGGPAQPAGTLSEGKGRRPQSALTQSRTQPALHAAAPPERSRGDLDVGRKGSAT